MRSGLRFDKVAVELLDRLRTGLRDDVAAGTVVLVTVTAPIRLSGKTAAAVEAMIRGLLEKPPARDTSTVIHENSVRVRIVRGAPKQAPPAIGFVHNPDVDAKTLLDAAGEVLCDSRAMPSLEDVYRYIESKLSRRFAQE